MQINLHYDHLTRARVVDEDDNSVTLLVPKFDGPLNDAMEDLGATYVTIVFVQQEDSGVLRPCDPVTALPDPVVEVEEPADSPASGADG